MANVTLPLRTVGVIFGTGFAGSWIYANSDIVRGVALDVLAASAKRAGSAHSSAVAPRAKAGNDGGELESLVSQVEHLAREVRRAGASQPIVLSSSWWAGVSWQTLAGVAAAFGLTYAVVGYGAGIWPSDVMWVTRAAFLKTYQALHQTVLRLSVAVNTIKDELSGRIRSLECQLDLAKKQIEEKMEGEVLKARKDISKVGREVSDIQDLIRGLECQLTDLEGKMHYANRGIYLLCQIVSGMPKDTSPNSDWEGLRKFSEVEPVALRIRTPVANPGTGIGQKGLEGILSRELEEVIRNVRIAERSSS